MQTTLHYLESITMNDLPKLTRQHYERNEAGAASAVFASSWGVCTAVGGRS